MTELEAIQLSRDLWYWLWKHPLKSKSDYPSYKENIWKMSGSCPCCQYYKVKEYIPTRCPLYVGGCSAAMCANGAFSAWASAKDKETSRTYSGMIYNKLTERYYQLIRAYFKMSRAYAVAEEKRRDDAARRCYGLMDITHC